jgi:putative two-component system response regulator
MYALKPSLPVRNHIMSAESGDETMPALSSEPFNPEILDAIKRMAYIAEYRKTNTLSHLDRMREYCLVIATGMGLAAHEAQLIAYASQLHDVGEIALPEQLVTRKEKLTSYEWDLVKRHPIVGAEILRGSPSAILQMGEVIALTHHERWDGSGYPQGLKAEEIPIGGRICALADVFDALTTRRPYKEELPVELAVGLLRESSGQFFDPGLVDVFQAELDRIVELRRMNI